MPPTLKGTRASQADVHVHNPSSTAKQRRFMGAELRRKLQGKKTRTGMSESQLRDFARKA